MTPAHSIILTVGLFALTFLSPGPNLLIVLQSSLSRGRGAGIAAGFGVACADGIYAALGLLGMAAVISQSSELFNTVKVIGGLYLLWVACRLVRSHPSTSLDATPAGSAQSYFKSFAQGLMTGLTNAQTIFFFASIFAVTLTVETPVWARVLSWLGIVSASVIWRVLLYNFFFHPTVRAVFRRGQRVFECLAGVILAGFGAKLLFDGMR